jgi:hypothetical protein
VCLCVYLFLRLCIPVCRCVLWEFVCLWMFLCVSVCLCVCLLISSSELFYQFQLSLIWMLRHYRTPQIREYWRYKFSNNDMTTARIYEAGTTLTLFIFCSRNNVWWQTTEKYASFVEVRTLCGNKHTCSLHTWMLLCLQYPWFMFLSPKTTFSQIVQLCTILAVPNPQRCERTSFAHILYKTI